MGRQRETVVSGRHCELARRRIAQMSVASCPYRSMHALDEPHAGMGNSGQRLARRDTEVDLVQAVGRWKLCSAHQPTRIDGGRPRRLPPEGELLVAADDRLTALLEWPELAQELTCRSGSHDR